MRSSFQRTVLIAVLSSLAACLLPACGSTGSSDGDASSDTESGVDSGSSSKLSEESFLDEVVADASDEGRDAAPKTSTPSSIDDDLGDSDLGVSDLVDESSSPRTEAPARSERTRTGERASGAAGEVFDAMREDAQVGAQSAKYWSAQGDNAFAARKYDVARDAYRKALDANPSDAEARRRWNETLVLLNERSGETPIVAEEIIDLLTIEGQQYRAEFSRKMSQATEAEARGDLERARTLLQSAIDLAGIHDDVASDEALASAKTNLRGVEQKIVDRDDSRRREAIEDADSKIQEELAEEQRQREMQVQGLLAKARRHLRLRDYRKSLEACDSVLVLEPDNQVALYWRRMSNDRLLDDRRQQVILDRQDASRHSLEDGIELLTPQEDFAFPEPEKWNQVRRRSNRLLGGAAVEDPEPVRRIKNVLETTMLQDINFTETPMRQVIDTFRQITGVNLTLDPDPAINWEDATFQVSQHITNMTAGSALRLILRSKGLNYGFTENILVISTPEKLRPETALEVYNISDLLAKIRSFAAPEIILRGRNDAASTGGPVIFSDEEVSEEEELDAESLVELLKATAGGVEVWDNESLGNTIQESNGQLFVTASADLHQKLTAVLESLRQDSDLFVVIEARFIDVFDDFLEDIGLDSRGLGLVNNLGTPFGNVINDNSTGGNDPGIVESGSPDDVNLVQGLERWAGRVQHIVDGFSGTIRGDRLTGNNGLGGGTFQFTWLEPFQVNVILRLVQEKQDVRQLTAPVVTAHNNQRVYVSVITQRAYISDYELVSGGTGFAIIEVADPVVATFQEGVILDVDPTVSHDKKYITLDVKPTLATLIGGVISTINISLGSFTNVAFQVPIGIPQISLQQAFTSVTVPNGGTVLLGGFKSMVDSRFESFLPILGEIPILKNLARRKATLQEKRSLVILLSARIVDLRGTEESLFNKG
jgi:general secretion pathway protein D